MSNDDLTPSFDPFVSLLDWYQDLSDMSVDKLDVMLNYVSNNSAKGDRKWIGGYQKFLEAGDNRAQLYAKASANCTFFRSPPRTQCPPALTPAVKHTELAHRSM